MKYRKPYLNQVLVILNDNVVLVESAVHVRLCAALKSESKLVLQPINEARLHTKDCMLRFFPLEI